MSRPDFFKDINAKRRSPACRAGLHDECDGTIPKKEWLEHERDCDCSCHRPLPEDDDDRIMSPKEA